MNIDLAPFAAVAFVHRHSDVAGYRPTSLGESRPTSATDRSAR